ncbi:MAG TPA: 2-oxoglutarate and iron-dependent oxygenase domain-containing protein [Alphaproteobacteria bacterium]
MVAYTQPRRTDIPLVDIGPSFSGAARDRMAVARQIRAACIDVGFFYVRGHQVPRRLVDGVFDAAHEFFARPLNEKMLCDARNSSALRGFESPGTQTLDPDSPPDIKESFRIGIDRGPDHPLVRASTPRHGPNNWPPHSDEFRQRVEGYFDAMLGLGRHLMGLIALSLDMSDEFFEQFYRDPNANLRLLHYPPHPAEALNNQLGCGAHTDWGAITMLAQDDCGGLEVQTAGGDWVVAEPIDDAFVVNLGDLLARWTNDLYRSTSHRVLNNRSGRDRYSMALFYDPDFHARIECLPGCRSAKTPPRYPPCTAGEHNYQMYCRTRGMAYAPTAPPAEAPTAV